MGSTLSSQPDQHKGYSQFEAAKRAYNNNERVVLIPIDESKQAEKAFECEYLLKLFYFRFISVININILYNNDKVLYAQDTDQLPACLFVNWHG